MVLANFTPRTDGQILAFSFSNKASLAHIKWDRTMTVVSINTTIFCTSSGIGISHYNNTAQFTVFDNIKEVQYVLIVS